MTAKRGGVRDDSKRGAKEGGVRMTAKEGGVFILATILHELVTKGVRNVG
jgi:hypothetical protein